MKEYLEILRQHEVFPIVMKELKEQRPTIPPYNHSPDNTEEWKSLSNQQRGYDLALSVLGEDNE